MKVQDNKLSDVSTCQLQAEIDRVHPIIKSNVITKILSTVFQKELDRRCCPLCHWKRGHDIGCPNDPLIP